MAHLGQQANGLGTTNPSRQPGSQAARQPGSQATRRPARQLGSNSSVCTCAPVQTFWLCPEQPGQLPSESPTKDDETIDCESTLKNESQLLNLRRRESPVVGFVKGVLKAPSRVCFCAFPVSQADIGKATRLLPGRVSRTRSGTRFPDPNLCPLLLAGLEASSHRPPLPQALMAAL